MILKALPKAIATLIRSGSLIQVPTKIVWFSSESITSGESASTRFIKLALLAVRFPNMGVKLEAVYKRADWPPPGTEYVSTFKHLWSIKNPTLRACRLKIIYKDVFSNERRHRFRLSDSPLCDICGQIESVEHQLFLCRNAVRIWNLYFRITGIRIGSLFEVLCCSGNMAHEIVKSTLIKCLIQINRSSNRSDRELIMDCSHNVGLELKVKGNFSVNLLQIASNLRAL